MAKRKRALTRLEKLLHSDGALCVTFVNTDKRQALESYQDLLTWGLETGALADADARRLADTAAHHPGKAAGAVRSVRTQRARLERILLALAGGGEPAASDIQLFNSALRQAMAVRELDPTGSVWTWGDTDGEDLDRMLWPVLLSAADLLTSTDRHRVRQCPDKDCGLLFVARGSGMPRKWCSAVCCNRRSSQLHYQKKIKPKRQSRSNSQRGAQRARLVGYDGTWRPPDPEEEQDQR